MTEIGLTFDDVQIEPQYSCIEHRATCNISQQFGRQTIRTPLIPANMDTIMGIDMARVAINEGGLFFFHRFGDMTRNVDKFVDRAQESVGISLGVNNLGENKSIFLYLQQLLIDGIIKNLNILFDVAHGDHILMYNAIDKISTLILPTIKHRITMTAGNIATFDAAVRMAELSILTAVKIGIGNGGLCFHPNTQIKTTLGQKKISDIVVGDIVYTHLGNEKIVEKVHSRSCVENELIKINDILCTPDHLFYVVHNTNIDKITDTNLHEYAQWISAKNLTKEWQLVTLQDI